MNEIDISRYNLIDFCQRLKYNVNHSTKQELKKDLLEYFEIYYKELTTERRGRR